MQVMTVHTQFLSLQRYSRIDFLHSQISLLKLTTQISMKCSAVCTTNEQ